jgi:outer membrane murein-binding lipoprotein Lpp
MRQEDVAMMRFVILASSLCLAGCASTRSLNAKGADEVVSSSQPARAIANCLADKSNAAPIDQGDGTFVITNKDLYGGALATFTVRPDGTGSKTEIRRGFSLTPVPYKGCFEK